MTDDTNVTPPADTPAQPMTTTVFTPPEFQLDGHTWRQEGYHIIDTCLGCLHQGVPIPPGTMLIKKEGKYQIVREY